MNLTTNIAGIELKNPIISTPGPITSYTSSSLKINSFGAVVARAGGKYMLGEKIINIENHNPKVLCEAPHGLINAIALESDGLNDLITKELPYLKKFDTKIIANVYGSTTSEYLEVSQKLEDEPIDFIELNISCPNIEGGIAFGTDPNAVESLVSTVKKNIKKPVIVKLSPNVSYITEIAKAAESGGADSLSMINTVYGLTIDTKLKKTTLKTGFGGYSGPGIMPIALYAVHECYKAVNIPIIGIGGISTFNDALQFLMAGAMAIGLGSVLKNKLNASSEILHELEMYMTTNKISSIKEIVGAVHN